MNIVFPSAGMSQRGKSPEPLCTSLQQDVLDKMKEMCYKDACAATHAKAHGLCLSRSDFSCVRTNKPMTAVRQRALQRWVDIKVKVSHEWPPPGSARATIAVPPAPIPALAAGASLAPAPASAATPSLAARTPSPLAVPPANAPPLAAAQRMLFSPELLVRTGNNASSVIMQPLFGCAWSSEWQRNARNADATVRAASEFSSQSKATLEDLLERHVQPESDECDTRVTKRPRRRGRKAFAESGKEERASRIQQMATAIKEINDRAHQLAQGDSTAAPDPEALHELVSKALRSKRAGKSAFIQSISSTVESASASHNRLAAALKALLKPNGRKKTKQTSRNPNGRATYALERRKRVEIASIYAGYITYEAAEKLGIDRRLYLDAKNHADEHGRGVPVPASTRFTGNRTCAERLHRLDEWITSCQLIQVLPYTHHKAVYRRSALVSVLWADYLRFVRTEELRFSQSYFKKVLYSGAFSVHKFNTGLPKSNGF